VPFGEYLPLQGLTDRLGLAALAAVLPGGYSPGSGPTLLDLGPELGHAFPMICYEAIFPGYIRQSTAARLDGPCHQRRVVRHVLGPVAAPRLARLRAAEQGLPVLRAANTGVSAVIDARGQIWTPCP
jgi:apolipoprotein N-acyltransferase